MSNKKITERELFERLVRVETKIDQARERDLNTTHSFQYYVGLIIFLQLINLILSISLLYLT